MATYTTNLSLIKPAGTDKIRIAQINQNMDTIDAAIGAVGNTSLQTQVTGISDSMNAVEGGIAIVSNNNTHVAITSGQYVYVKNHATLSEGLYRATQAIATNGTLTLSNVTPESAGGLNSLNEQIANVGDGKITSGDITTKKPSDYNVGITIEDGNDISEAGVLVTFKFSHIRCVQFISNYSGVSKCRGALNASEWTSWNSL